MGGKRALTNNSNKIISDLPFSRQYHHPALVSTKPAQLPVVAALAANYDATKLAILTVQTGLDKKRNISIGH